MATLIQELESPVHGYWDGGAKSRFEWDIQGPVRRDAKGEYVRVGSWEANHWFHVSVGKTDVGTLKKAATHLRQNTNVSCKFVIVDDGGKRHVRRDDGGYHLEN